MPFDGLARVRTLLDDAASLPVVEASARVDEPIVQSHEESCIVLNYADHARGCGMEPPGEPMMVNEAPNAVVGLDDDVLLPPSPTMCPNGLASLSAVVSGSRASRPRPSIRSAHGSRPSARSLIPASLRLSLGLNDNKVQSATTSNLIFGLGHVVSTTSGSV